MTKPSPQFDGQISIVTGAGSGFGFATAEGLAVAGATVFCVDWKGAEEAAASIRASGGNATGVMLDVRDSAGWTALVEGVVARHGPIDILVNNAGIAVPGDTAAEVSEEVWDRILDINAKGVWLGMRAVLPGMVARKHGKICNVASTAAHIGLRDAAAYCASKGAVLALTRQAGVPLTPIGRFAESPEVAAAILFLVSSGSSFITGADVSVDGGMVAL